MPIIPGMAEKLRDEGEARGLHKEARRIARKTLWYGKDWRANGGGTVVCDMRTAVDAWEKDTGMKWEDVFGKGKR